MLFGNKPSIFYDDDEPLIKPYYALDFVGGYHLIPVVAETFHQDLLIALILYANMKIYSSALVEGTSDA